MRLSVCLVLLAWGGFSSVRADPVWIQPKGTFHTALSYTQAVWDQYLQADGSSVNLPGEVMQYEFTAYAEYVPLDNLSFDLLAPLIFSQRKFVFLVTDPLGQIIDVQLGPGGEVRDVDTNGGIGDIVLGGKWVFWDKGISLGVRPYVKFPGTYTSGEVPNAPGDGQTDLGLSFLVGSYFTSIRTYLRGSLALVYRTGDPENQMEIMLEPGVNITDHLNARFIYQWINQFGGTDFDYYSVMNFYPGNEEDAHRIGGGLTYRATDTFGIFGLYQQTVAGRNTANTKAFTIGVDFSF